MDQLGQSRNILQFSDAPSTSKRNLGGNWTKKFNLSCLLTLKQKIQSIKVSQTTPDEGFELFAIPQEQTLLASPLLSISI
jgi:hypothetical protein